MRHVLIEESSEDFIQKKIQYPHIQDIESLKIEFKESFDTILLFEYEVGTLDN